MNRDRAKRLARLAAVEKVRSDALRRQAAAEGAVLAESRAGAAAILAALNEGSPLHGHLVGAMSAALKANTAQTAALQAQAEATRRAATVQEKRSDVLAARAQEAARHEARKRERRVLEDLVTAPQRRRRHP